MIVLKIVLTELSSTVLCFGAGICSAGADGKAGLTVSEQPG